jgi:hypothetical protein
MMPTQAFAGIMSTYFVAPEREMNGRAAVGRKSEQAESLMKTERMANAAVC